MLAVAAACRASAPYAAPALPVPAPIRTEYAAGEDVIAAMRSRYDTNVSVDPRLFDPATWKSATHWKAQ